jgi:hypothetical protein
VALKYPTYETYIDCFWMKICPKLGDNKSSHLLCGLAELENVKLHLQHIKSINHFRFFGGGG